MTNLRSYKNLHKGCQRLWSQFAASKNSNAIIADAYDIIGNPIIINTQIVHFKSIGVKTNALIDRLFTFEEDITRSNAGKAHICLPAQIPWSDPQIAYGYADAGIFRGGAYWGRVLILGEKQPLDSDTLEYAETLAKIMAVIFEEDIFPQLNSMPPHLPLFHSLMSSEPLDAARIKKQMDNLDILPERGMNIVVIDQRSQSMLAAQANMETFSKMLNSKIYALYRGNIVLINNRTPERKFSLGDTVQKALGDLGFRCGVSREFFHLNNVPRFYKQAIFTLHIGRLFSDPSPVLEYENYSTEHSICQMSQTGDPFYALDPRLIKLKDYDESGPNYLMETLETHMRNIKSPTAGANELCIHRNTYFYRLGKISEITGWDLNDGYCIAKVAFYLKILKLLQMAGPAGQKVLAELAGKE